MEIQVCSQPYVTSTTMELITLSSNLIVSTMQKREWVHLWESWWNINSLVVAQIMIWLASIYSSDWPETRVLDYMIIMGVPYVSMQGMLVPWTILYGHSFKWHWCRVKMMIGLEELNHLQKNIQRQWWTRRQSANKRARLALERDQHMVLDNSNILFDTKPTLRIWLMFTYIIIKSDKIYHFNWFYSIFAF